jgi:MFS family permease
MVGETLVFPSSELAVSDFANQINVGTYFGIFNLSWAIGAMIGSYLGTWLLATFPNTIVPWITFGIIGLIAFILLAYVPDPARQKEIHRTSSAVG